MTQLEDAWSISRLARTLKERVESDFPATWVRGELVGVKRYPSGHLYFALRDELAKIDCTVWRSVASRIRTPIEEGAEVFALGTPAVWEERSSLRFNVVQILPASAVGATAQSIEATKQALLRDGLLDPARKRPLPSFPQRIAVITSVAGAAVRDVITVARRRWPSIDLLVINAAVQGENAPAELVEALTLLPLLSGVDLCIIGRGGGAREDLAAFNNEAVCRAIAASPVPVICAVGHEVDITLADLVADLRAATPSQAAEFALPERDEIRRRVEVLDTRLQQATRVGLQRRAERLERTRDRMASALTNRLRSIERRVLTSAAALVPGLERHVRRPRERLAALDARLAPAISSRLSTLSASLERSSATLHALSPLAVLARGYAVASTEDGSIVRRTHQLPSGAAFTLRLHDGTITAHRDPT